MDSLVSGQLTCSQFGSGFRFITQGAVQALLLAPSCLSFVAAWCRHACRSAQVYAQTMHVLLCHRALKTKHETPKYGLIYHASLIGQSAPKFKGKISRVLAAKCSLAIRVDALGDSADASIGLEARSKVNLRSGTISSMTWLHTAEWSAEMECCQHSSVFSN